mgnify:CR=1 FL=1
MRKGAVKLPPRQINQWEKIMELQKIHGLITNITQHYSAFAVDAEGQNTFITNNLARFLQLTVGDQVLMDVVPNHPDKAITIPYRAVGCVKLKESLPEEEPEQPEPEPDNGVLEQLLKEWTELKQSPQEIMKTVTKILSDADTYLINAEVVAAYREEQPDQKDVSDKDINNACHRLFKQSKIAKAEVWAKPDQSKCSYNLWAFDASRFTL